MDYFITAMVGSFFCGAGMMMCLVDWLALDSRPRWQGVMVLIAGIMLVVLGVSGIKLS